MSKNRFDLHEERLSTTDEDGHRVYLFPEDVKGLWKKRREIVFWFLIFLYLVLPWIYIDGKQVVLLNLPKREFHFFGQLFYGHDAPLLFFVFAIFLFLMGLLTSFFGRAWCGWACPQTVFIETLYSRLERLIEGKARERRKLNESSWNLDKLFKKGIKWFLFLMVSLHLSHSFVGYFVGTRELLEISLQSPQENITLFSITMFLTVLFLFDFGWFREQFCLIACPYGRLQSVIMDEDSLVVAYDQKRGEPRRGSPNGPEGDCINCFHCVKVCPTGIDIRRGTQLECIACTHCIDACDEIMEKVGKPKGLIRYDSENGLEKGERRIWTKRRGVYTALLFFSFAAFVYSINLSQGLKVHLLRGGKQGFTLQQDRGRDLVINHFKLTFDTKKNYSGVRLSLEDHHHPSIKVILQKNPFKIKEGHSRMNFFLKFPKEILEKGTYKTKIILRDHQDKIIYELKDVSLVGPV